MCDNPASHDDARHEELPPKVSRRALFGATSGGLLAGVALGVGGTIAVESQWPSAPQDFVYAGTTGTDRLGILPIIWSVPVSTRAFSLTFDDGPDPDFTPKVLAALAEFGVLATFNIMGWNALHHGDLLREVIAGGHEIANHSWSHLDAADTEADVLEREVLYGKQVIEEISGQTLTLFRPPRGNITGAQLRFAAQAGEQVVVWSFNGGLGGTPSVAELRDRSVAGIEAGDIVLLHDGIGRGTFQRDSSSARDLIAARNREIEALPGVIDGVLARGLRPMTVSQLLAEPRITL